MVSTSMLSDVEREKKVKDRHGCQKLQILFKAGVLRASVGQILMTRQNLAKRMMALPHYIHCGLIVLPKNISFALLYQAIQDRNAEN